MNTYKQPSLSLTVTFAEKNSDNHRCSLETLGLGLDQESLRTWKMVLVLNEKFWSWSWSWKKCLVYISGSK